MDTRHVTNSARKGMTPFSGNPSLKDPETHADLILPLLESQRQRVEERANRPGNGGMGHNPLPTLERVSAIESRPEIRRRLEELAVHLIRQEYGLTEQQLQFRVKLCGLRDVAPNFTKLYNSKEVDRNFRPDQQKAASPQEGKGRKDDAPQMPKGSREPAAENKDPKIDPPPRPSLWQRMTGQTPDKGEKSGAKSSAVNPKKDPRFEAELNKRMMLNALIIGGSERGADLFHMEAENLKDISPELVNGYRKLMPLGEMAYWQYPDEVLNRMSNDPNYPVGGRSKLDFSTEPITVVAAAAGFPTLLRELSTGVMEFLCLTGLPAGEQDGPLRREVMKKADTNENEIWCVRLGPSVWAKFIEAAGPDARPVRNLLVRQFAALPAEEFEQVMAEILSKGKSERLTEMKEALLEKKAAAEAAAEEAARAEEDSEYLDEDDNEDDFDDQNLFDDRQDEDLDDERDDDQDEYWR